MGQGSGPAHRLTYAERLELQSRVRAGARHVDAAAAVGCSAKSVQRLLLKTGGVKSRTIARSALRVSLAQREEIAQQNTSLKSELATKGLIFNDVDPAPFRETLSKSGFYAEWKAKFGDEAWSLLEESTGKLA